MSILEQIKTAIEKLGVGASSLSASETSALRDGAASRFGTREDAGGPLWRLLNLSPTVESPDAWRWIAEYLQERPAILFFSPQQEATAFEFANGREIVPVLDECDDFEFYVTDRELSFVLSFNEESLLTAAGAAEDWLRDEHGVEDDGTGGMSPGGWDNTFLSTSPPSHVLHGMLMRMLKRWPTLIGAIAAPDQREFSARSMPAPSEFDGDFNELLLFRDEAMMLHDEETGGELLDDGEGSIHLLSSRFTETHFDITVSAEDPAREDDWRALLACPVLYRYTIVTPADPKSDPFSKEMCDLVLRICSAS